MKTIGLLTLAFLFFISQTRAQENGSKTSKPDEKITVNREYDDEGNLIRFDSTYVFQWFGDTMMAFPGGGNFMSAPGGFPDMDHFMSQFFGDSTFMSPFEGDWHNDIFQRHEEMMKNFEFPFDQNGFMDGFTFGSDSLNYYFGNDSTGIFPPFFDEFDFPDFSQFFKEFEGFEGNHRPSFNNDEEEKQWQEMMERHQKEMEELQQKWDSKNKSKPRSDLKLQKI